MAPASFQGSPAIRLRCPAARHAIVESVLHSSSGLDGSHIEIKMVVALPAVISYNISNEPYPIMSFVGPFVASIRSEDTRGADFGLRASESYQLRDAGNL